MSAAAGGTAPGKPNASTSEHSSIPASSDASTAPASRAAAAESRLRSRAIRGRRSSMEQADVARP